MEKLNAVIDYLLTHKLIFTLIILLFAVFMRRVALSQIRGDAAFLTEHQRKWMSSTKNGTFAATLFVLFVLWQPEIQSVCVVCYRDSRGDCGCVQRDHPLFYRFDSARQLALIPHWRLD